MNFIKNFFSHLFAIVFLLALLLLSLTHFSRELITYDKIYNSLEDSKLLKSEITTNPKLINLNINEELYEYVEIEDMLYEYFTNRFLLEAKVISIEPSLDIDLLNKNIETGLEKYIDAKKIEKNIDIDEVIDSLKEDQETTKQLKEYAHNNQKIDLTNKYIGEKEIEYIEEYADEVLNDIKESTYVFDIIDIIFNDSYTTIYIIVLISSLVLIAIINLNIIPAISLAVMPILINVIIYLVVTICTLFVNVGGSSLSLIINGFLDEMSFIAFKYFLIMVGVLLFALFTQLIAKLIYAKILKKKGITTEDNVLDDYDEIDKKEEK